MAHHNTTLLTTSLEEAVTVLFCLMDDAYRNLNPRGGGYGALKRLSDSEVITLALFQQLRGVESERSFLRDAGRFFSHLFPGVAGLHPSSFHRRIRKLRRFLEPLRRTLLEELVGDPETLIVGSTLLEILHRRQAGQSAGWAASSSGAAWVRWGTSSVYGVKLHFLCSTNCVPISYELTVANAADVLLVRELLAGAGLEDDGVARRLLGDLAYRSEALREELAEVDVLLATERADARRSGSRRRSASQCSRAPSGWTGRWRTRWWVGYQDRGKGGGLHLRLVCPSTPREVAGAHQGALGMKSSQHSSR